MAFPKLNADVKDSITPSLKSGERLALTRDSWCDPLGKWIHMLTITKHHISDAWTLVSHVSQTKGMHTSHIESNLATNGIQFSKN